MIEATLIRHRILMTAAAFAIIWQLIFWSGAVPERYFPGIDRIVVGLFDMLASGDLIVNGARTFLRAVIGLAGAALLGIGLAILSDLSPVFRKGFRPVAEMLQSIPPAALVPTAVFSLGLGIKLYAFVIILVTVWPPYFNGVAALAAISPVQLATGRMLGLGPARLLWQIKLPAAMPEIFAGIRYAATIALIAVIVSEMLAGRDGIGFMLFKKAFAIRTAEVFALMFVTALMGVALNRAVAGLRWLVTGWHIQMMERPA
jgi:ABC-type nitrate/sulfonate/bicarbonate transport system permease component